MKIIIALLLSCFSMLSYAVLPAQFKVYQTGVGTANSICRVLFDEYNKEYNANTLISVKSGASGMMAMLDMIKDKNFSVQCGTSLSESVFNITTYPGNEEAHNLLTMVSMIAEGTTVFTTRYDSPYNTLPELLKSNKPLMIGYHATTPKISAEIVVGSSPVTWVAYKTSADAISSLIDGSLDFYVDGGGLIPLIQSKKLKSLGHLNGLDSSPGIDLKKEYPDASRVKIIFAIVTSKNNASVDIEELNSRIRKLMLNDAVINSIVQSSYLPTIKTVKESNDYIDNFKKRYNVK